MSTESTFYSWKLFTHENFFKRKHGRRKAEIHWMVEQLQAMKMYRHQNTKAYTHSSSCSTCDGLGASCCEGSTRTGVAEAGVSMDEGGPCTGWGPPFPRPLSLPPPRMGSRRLSPVAKMGTAGFLWPISCRNRTQIQSTEATSNTNLTVQFLGNYPLMKVWISTTGTQYLAYTETVSLASLFKS